MKKVKTLLMFVILTFILTSCVNNKIFTHEHNGSYLHCSICKSKNTTNETEVSKSSAYYSQENNVLASNEKGINQALVSEIYQFENHTKCSNYNSIAVVKHVYQNKKLKPIERNSKIKYPIDSNKGKEIKHPGLNYALAGLLIIGLLYLVIDYGVSCLLPFVGLFFCIKALRKSSKGDVLVKALAILGIIINLLTGFVVFLYLMFTYNLL